MIEKFKYVISQVQNLWNIYSRHENYSNTSFPRIANPFSETVVN